MTKRQEEPDGLFESLLHEAVADELNQLRYTGKVKLLKDFTAEERKTLEAQYNCKIKPQVKENKS